MKIIVMTERALRIVIKIGWALVFAMLSLALALLRYAGGLLVL
jgi:hypothetical protein